MLFRSNNKPSPFAILSSAQVGHQILWYEWDVTTYVRDEINTGQTFSSFAFRASNVTTDITLINSLEADVSKPLLIVVNPSPTQTVVNPTDDSFVRGGNNSFMLLPAFLIASLRFFCRSKLRS